MSKMASHRNELYTALSSYLAALSFGYTIGYSSPALPQMMSSERIMQNNEDAASWFGSIATLGAMLGCVIAGFVMEYRGRRPTLLLTSIPFFIGWLCIVFGNEIEILCLGRFLTGIGCGAVCVGAPVYVAEMAPRELRGMLGAGVQLSVTVGILLVYTLGVLVGWRVLASIGALIPIVALVVTWWLPESPRYLLTRQRNTEAVGTLVWLRGASAVAENECREMEKSLSEANNQASLLELLSRPELSRPLVVVLTIMIFQQATGINVVMFYCASIFKAAGFSESSGLATIAIGAVQVGATIVACVLVDSKGRLKMLVIAGLGMAVSCAVLGTYYHLAQLTSSSSADVTEVHPVSSYSWIALICLIAYMMAFSLGWGPIPMLFMSEVFPARARGSASALSILVNFFMAFFVTKFFSSLSASFGLNGTFWIFGVVCLVAVIFVLRYMPETKGRSLEDIERFFLGHDLVRGM